LARLRNICVKFNIHPEKTLEDIDLQDVGSVTDRFKDLPVSSRQVTEQESLLNGHTLFALKQKAELNALKYKAATRYRLQIRQLSEVPSLKR